MANNTLVKESKNRILDELYSDRSSWETVWKDLQKYINPERGRLDSEADNDGTRRDTIAKVMLDSKPREAARICAAGIHSGLTSPARTWFKLNVSDEEKNEDQSIRSWLDDCEKIMTNIYSKSNVYAMLYQTYAELTQFGTSASLIFEDFNTGIRCISLTTGEYAGSVDARGRVAKLGRKMTFTSYAMVKEFGLENVSDTVKGSYESQDITTRFEVKCLIEENDEYADDKLKLDGTNFPWLIYYWEDGSDDFLRVGGFNECPFLMPRWDVVANNVYGTGPGNEALGDCKQLQKFVTNQSRISDTEANPPIIASSKVKYLNKLPGGVTRVNDELGFKTSNLLAPNQGYSGLEALIQRKYDKIESAFFNNLFLMLANSNNRGDMTAREVSERSEEKLLMLGPVLERMHDEVLAPLTKRVFSICIKNKLFPESPSGLKESEIKVEFVSQLAQAQKMAENTSIEKVVSFTGNLAGAKPDVLDVLNFDKIVRSYSNVCGMDGDLLLQDSEVEALRQQRLETQQQAQQSQQMQAEASTASQGANAARLLSETQTNNGSNALQDVLNNI